MTKSIGIICFNKTPSIKVISKINFYLAFDHYQIIPALIFRSFLILIAVGLISNCSKTPLMISLDIIFFGHLQLKI